MNKTRAHACPQHLKNLPLFLCATAAFTAAYTQFIATYIAVNAAYKTLYLAETTRAARVFLERLIEMCVIEIGEEHVCKIQLGIGRLPEQKV